MYYAPKVVFDRIMSADDMPEAIPPTPARHDSDDPFKCTACLARGGGDIS